MIGLALCGVAGIALVGAGVAVLLRAPRRTAEPLSLRPVELSRRGIGQ